MTELEDWQILLGLFRSEGRQLGISSGAVRRLRGFRFFAAYAVVACRVRFSLRETAVQAKLAAIAGVSDVTLLNCLLRSSNAWAQQRENSPPQLNCLDPSISTAAWHSDQEVHLIGMPEIGEIMPPDYKLPSRIFLTLDFKRPLTSQAAAAGVGVQQAAVEEVVAEVSDDDDVCGAAAAEVVAEAAVGLEQEEGAKGPSKNSLRELLDKCE
jgi:hypothetical protein